MSNLKCTLKVRTCKNKCVFTDTKSSKLTFPNSIKELNQNQSYNQYNQNNQNNDYKYQNSQQNDLNQQQYDQYSYTNQPTLNDYGKILY